MTGILHCTVVEQAHTIRKADVCKLQSKKKSNMFCDPEACETVSEAEKSLNLVASPHRPKGTNIKLDNSYLVILTVPPPPPGLPPRQHCREKAECCISIMKHKPPEHLVGNCNLQTPACDTESNSNTQDCVFFSRQNGNDLWSSHQNFQTKPW